MGIIDGEFISAREDGKMILGENINLKRHKQNSGVKYKNKMRER
jgi:hypothetical protein